MWCILYINNQDIYNKPQNFKFIFGTILCSFETSNEVTLLKLHKIMVLPIFLHMCDNYTLLKQCEIGITTAKMKLVMAVAGYTLYINKSNE